MKNTVFLSFLLADTEVCQYYFSQRKEPTLKKLQKKFPTAYRQAALRLAKTMRVRQEAELMKLEIQTENFKHSVGKCEQETS